MLLVPNPVIITLVYVDNPWKWISYIGTANELIPHPTFWYGWTLEVSKHTTDYNTNIGTYCKGYINYLIYYLVPSWYISTLWFWMLAKYTSNIPCPRKSHIETMDGKGLKTQYQDVFSWVRSGSGMVQMWLSFMQWYCKTCCQTYC